MWSSFRRPHDRCDEPAMLGRPWITLVTRLRPPSPSATVAPEVEDGRVDPAPVVLSSRCVVPASFRDRPGSIPRHHARLTASSRNFPSRVHRERRGSARCERRDPEATCRAFRRVLDGEARRVGGSRTRVTSRRGCPSAVDAMAEDRRRADAFSDAGADRRPPTSSSTPSPSA